MRELSADQRAALEYAQHKILEQYRMRKAPSVAELEGIARRAVDEYIAHRRVLDGVHVEPVGVRIEHHGGGSYTMVPVLAEVIHSITISATIGAP